MSLKPFLIGIAGGSCSGKTEIANRLAGNLRADDRVLIIGLDCYYNDFTGVPPDQIEVDVPESLDRTLLFAQLEALAAGSPVEKPVYDYVTHSRAPQGFLVEPGNFVIVEGLFTLFWPEICDLLGLSVFVSVDHKTALSRRLARDTTERGRTKKSVLWQYENKVQPMYDRYVHPTRENATLVLDGLEPLDSSVKQIRAHLPFK